ncbi:MAG: chemotaxis protein CheX [Candidatus Omnitrophota bacterium]
MGEASNIRQQVIEVGRQVVPYIFDQMTGIPMTFNEEITRKVEYAVLKLRFRLAYDLTSLVSVRGAVNGYVCLHLSKSLLFQAISQMISQPVAVIDNNVKDGAGELGNIVTGNMKTQLYSRGIKYNIGLPLILCGTYVASSARPPLVSSVSVFTSPYGNGCLEVAVDAPAC